MTITFPEVNDGPIWLCKMRTLFRRLDTSGHGYLMIDDLLEIGTSIINVYPKMIAYKYDELIKTLIYFWYDVICTHVPRQTATLINLNESKFIDNLLKAFKGQFHKEFDNKFLTPLFISMDQDDDGKLTGSEFHTLMLAWKSIPKDIDLLYRLYSDGNKMNKENFTKLFIEFFMSNNAKSKENQLWGSLINYKRAEDYGTIDCGPVWEGKIRTMYRRLDVNETMKLRCHDLLQIGQFLVQRAHLDRRRSDAVMRAMLNIWVKFLAVDKNGEHLDEIREIEFVHNMREMINGEYRHEIDQFGWTFFKAIEVDNSGFISQASYRILQEAWHVGREEAEGMFKILDTDKDGKISSDEFLTAWNEYFLSEDPQSPYRMFFGPVISRPTEAR
ncbi:Sarcoplasmic calcium-binding protein [Schistosoma japonicum]|uniref:Sarcoplasmic calcium-binding protein n=2 Tax=Schistosoma japonicum TaxID=6182 RepID=A0A4Z2CRW2_SCHJA|nr:Sarcoplasmic calcium-binding protein [Schistosoma japonicum]TNN06955.1 Sarcoplasmic calcium-binding protein [Schistosoma japonicum]